MEKKCIAQLKQFLKKIKKAKQAWLETLTGGSTDTFIPLTKERSFSIQGRSLLGRDTHGVVRE